MVNTNFMFVFVQQLLNRSTKDGVNNIMNIVVYRLIVFPFLWVQYRYMIKTVNAQTEVLQNGLESDNA